MPADENADVKTLIKQAQAVLTAVGMDRKQQGERTARVLLALLQLSPGMSWSEASSRPMGIEQIRSFIAERPDIAYAANTRESIRKESVRQLVDSGILLFNADMPDRATNDRNSNYRISPDALALFRTYETVGWSESLLNFLKAKPSLVERRRQERTNQLQRVDHPDLNDAALTPGVHSELIRQIVDVFVPTFIGFYTSEILYIGDTGQKFHVLRLERLTMLGVTGVNLHGKFPDVIVYDKQRDWLVLIEAVTSVTPINPERREQLLALFQSCREKLVFVTAFPQRNGAAARTFITEIAWETEVWFADHPTHLLHFNGERFLGPYV